MMSRNSHGSKGMIWTGRVLSALPILMMLGTGIPALMNPSKAEEGMQKYGYPHSAIVPILIAEIACAILYAIPQTAVLGAVLLTGYLGGATATHVRAGEQMFVVPVVVGVIIWLGLFLRDSRLRALLPFRSI